jgi:TRAP-type C4-dicarboxylate transport system substrate-binding protein
MDMRRREFSSTLALALTAGLCLGAGQAMAQTKWNLPAAYAASNYHSENLVAFAEDVKKATGGKLEITVHAGASLFKAPEIKRAVATGQAQMGEVLISIHENEDPVYGLDTIPFLASSYAESRKLAAARADHMGKKLDGQGIRVLFVVPWGPQGIYAKKDIAKIDDMKGLKMRTYNVGTTRIAELVGAQGVTVQAAELSQALATGTVNAFMTSGATGYDSKVWETMTHFYNTQAWIPHNVTFVNKAAFDGLAKDQQDAILAAAKTAETRGWKVAEEKAAWYVGELKAKGMKVLDPSAELNDGLKKIGAQLVDDWVKKAGADGKTVVDAFRK